MIDCVTIHKNVLPFPWGGIKYPHPVECRRSIWLASASEMWEGAYITSSRGFQSKSMLCHSIISCFHNNWQFSSEKLLSKLAWILVWRWHGKEQQPIHSRHAAGINDKLFFFSPLRCWNSEDCMLQPNNLPQPSWLIEMPTSQTGQGKPMRRLLGLQLCYTLLPYAWQCCQDMESLRIERYLFLK